MSVDDTAYFTRRAEQEQDLAQRATRAEVVKAHFELAEAYLERAASAEPARQTEDA